MVRTQKSMSVASGNIGPNYIAPIPAGSRDWPKPGIEKSTPGLQSLEATKPLASIHRCSLSLSLSVSFVSVISKNAAATSAVLLRLLLFAVT